MCGVGRARICNGEDPIFHGLGEALERGGAPALVVLAAHHHIVVIAVIAPISTSNS